LSARSARAWRLPGIVWALGGMVTAYLALGWLFAYETQVRGLLTPGGSPNLDVVTIGGAYLVLRVVVRFGAPSIVVLAITRALVNTRRPRCPVRASSSGPASPR
jgi:hypothetical protein